MLSTLLAPRAHIHVESLGTRKRSTSRSIVVDAYVDNIRNITTHVVYRPEVRMRRRPCVLRQA